MNSRIKQFMDYKGITASELADNIGVQRSNVTHVLHGRNKPSFQFIAKLLETYPEIDAKWLIMGEGEMLESNTVKTPNLFTNAPSTAEEVLLQTVKEIETEPVKEEVKSPKQEFIPIAKIASEASPDREIERIVVFYTDQTFKQYIPSK